MAENHVSLSNERFLSAAQKRKILEAWKRFLRGGCAFTQFSKDLYHHLIQHCSFIAHYDRHGFYDFYFGRITPELFRFFDQFDPELPGISAEYGTVHWLSEHNTGSDLNHAMRQAAGAYLPALRHRFGEAKRQAEISVANIILARYGLIAVPTSSAPAAVDHTPAQTRLPNPRQPIQPPLFD